MISLSDGGMYVSKRHYGFCFVVMYGGRNEEKVGRLCFIL